MQIQLKQLKEEIGGVLPFDYELDLSSLEPSAQVPVRVCGRVINRAGVLLLSMELTGVVHLACDRCAKEFEREKRVSYETALADHIEGEESDEILVCENDVLELDELAGQVFLLNLDSKNLCREDCAGLCPTCGTDLNVSTCSCARDAIDPRLEKLRALLDEE